MLRIIAGALKGRRIRTVDSQATRPMTDRVRESLFSILAPELPGADFLDLFAGSGAVAIEALSRGCRSAVLVDSSRRCVDVIKGNLSSLGLGTRAAVRHLDAYAAARTLSSEASGFDIVFAGPPYDGNHHNRIASAVAEAGLCKAGGTMVLQYRSGDELTPPPGYSADTRSYGITSLSFLRRLDA